MNTLRDNHEDKYREKIYTDRDDYIYGNHWFYIILLFPFSF